MNFERMIRARSVDLTIMKHHGDPAGDSRHSRYMKRYDAAVEVILYKTAWADNTKSRGRIGMPCGRFATLAGRSWVSVSK